MADPDDMLERLIAEILDRQVRGESPTAPEYIERYPHLREGLREFFATFSDLTQTSVPRRPPTHIGGYQLLEVLGRGAMGTVYTAEQADSGRLVAIKLLDPAHSSSTTTGERFRREANIAKRLRHPNLVAVYDHGESSGQLYYVMQLVQGVTLAQMVKAMRASGKDNLSPRQVVHDLLRRQGMFDSELLDSEESGLSAEGDSNHVVIARIIASVAEGLDYAHKLGVIHRDVKPHNILIDQTLQPYITDFGLARDMDAESLTRTGDIVGTTYYVSPEIATARLQDVDHRTDIYSLGVTMYELLTKQVPFTGSTSREVFERIIHASPPMPSRLNAGIPADLQNITLKAIAKSPIDRYASAREFADDLRRFARSEQVLARPMGVLKRTVRWMQRNRGAAIAMVLISVSLLVFSLVRSEARAKMVESLTQTIDAQLAAEDYYGASKSIVTARSIRDDPGLSERDDFAIGIVRVQLEAPEQVLEVAIRQTDSVSGMPIGEPIPVKLQRGKGEVKLKMGAYWLDAKQGGGDVESYVAYTEQFFQLERSSTPIRIPVQMRNTEECIADMVRVPGGSYRVGWDGTKQAGNRRFTPRHRKEELVQSPAFYIDRCEVSNADYAEFVQATKARPPWRNGSFAQGAENHPVAGVSWLEATQYAQWRGKRLPTQTEWEIAARGPESLDYPWGNEFLASKANISIPMARPMGQVSMSMVTAKPMPVDEPLGDISSVGCRHMVGNVREWVADPWQPREQPLAEESYLMIRPGLGCVRGSSYLCPSDVNSTRASYQTPLERAQLSSDVGFRCAKSVLP